MILIHSDKWAGFPVRYWLRNDNVFLAMKAGFVAIARK
jgi:hypothetical protein